MRYFLSFAIFSLSLCVVSLNAQTVSEHGYRYVHHQKNKGPKPRRGEAMIGQVDVFVGNFLLSSSRKTGAGIYRYEIPPVEAEMTHYPPIYDAALLMSVGDSLTIFQNVDDNMRQYLPPEEKQAKEIRFEIVLREIVTAEQKAVANKTLEAAVQQLGQRIQTKVKAYAAGLLDAEITRRPSGLKILVEEPGKGEAVREGEPIQVHYYGCLKNGVMFDNSYSRRQPLQFPAGVGEMIAGFDEGVMQLRHGARAYLFIPPSLGYGDQDAAGGTIPANSELIFYIEVL
ncbi:MAG: FKBP-type peptidyl-prolyl cis-trans isomerase [Saprospiraceae bacterium]|nr:FKBP-type peptidyl-prolyl cis-trans isomerase [Saprospiraceae bacterium]